MQFRRREEQEQVETLFANAEAKCDEARRESDALAVKC